MQIYRVKSNESVYDIAREYGVSPMKIAYDNDLDIRSRLPIGREILIITPSRSYTIKSGDTVEGVARRFKVNKESLMRSNPELGGRERMYQGQILTVKESSPSYGMISANGYLYSGTSKESLIALMPYLGYVTVCSAVYKDGRIHSLFRSEESVALIKACGRAPIVRIYLTELPALGNEKDFAGSIAILAGGGGFAGVTLSGLGSVAKDSKRLDALVLAVRRQLLENDLLLFTEGDLDGYTGYMEYSDAGILTYDKLHKGDIPSFANGEAAVLEKFAYSGESSRAFVEISAFAYSGGRYIEKREAIRISDKRRGEVTADEERKITVVSYGKHKRREIIYESLENTKAKLELISELGFMGISLDIGRVCTADLMMAASTFDLISHPILFPSSGSINQEI